MFEIPIKKLEKRLGKKIKRNFSTIGFDTAESTGVCKIRTDDKIAYFDTSFIHFDNSNIHFMYKQMVLEFGSVIEMPDFIVAEDTFLGFNVDAMKKLTRFGAFIMCIAIQKGIPYELIAASPARSRLEIPKPPKGKSKSFIAKWLKKKLDITVDDDDIADSIILALLGIIDGIDFRSKAAIKKAKG